MGGGGTKVLKKQKSWGTRYSSCTAEVIVDTERPVNREGNNIKSCLYRVARESKIPEHICVHPAELPYPCI